MTTTVNTEEKQTFQGAKDFPKDGITGEFLGSKLIPKKGGFEKESIIHQVGLTNLWGTAMLNALFDRINVGETVTVTYEGKEKTDKGYKHLWNVAKTETE